MKVNLKRISLFFRRLLHRSFKKAEAAHEREKPKEEWIYPPRPRRTIVVKAGRQATRQDVSKFMKHGKQASWYRKSVKAKIKPEDN
jgi:hypothetical protein